MEPTIQKKTQIVYSESLKYVTWWKQSPFEMLKDSSLIKDWDKALSPFLLSTSNFLNKKVYNYEV